MRRALFPFHFLATSSAASILRGHSARVAVLALKAILKHRKGLEVAHQQITYQGHCFAFSSRISTSGELYLELDVGDPRLNDRLILEEDFRNAGKPVRGISRG